MQFLHTKPAPILPAWKMISRWMTKNAEIYPVSACKLQSSAGIKAKEEPQLICGSIPKFNVKSLGMNTMQKVKRTSLEYTLRAGFKNSAAPYNRIFAKLVTDDLQEVMDAYPLRHASIEHIKIYTTMYKYAMANNLCTKDYSSYVKKSHRMKTHGVLA